MVIFAFILFAKRIFLGDHSVCQPTCDSILLRLLKKFDIYSHTEKKNNILKQADVLTCLVSYWWYWNSSFFTFLWSATNKHFSYIFCYYFINLFQRLKEISSQEMKNSFAIRITMLRFFFPVLSYLKSVTQSLTTVLLKGLQIRSFHKTMWICTFRNSWDINISKSM